jgi:hypothetical protein
MTYKPDEKDWMAYLYGELEGAEKERFDKYILEHPEARQELERFQGLRNLLSSAEDKEVIAPPVFVDVDVDNKYHSHQRSFWSAPYLKTVVGIAASLLIIMLMGKLTGTRLIVSDQSVTLAFGPQQTVSQPQQKTTPALSQEQVQEMINQSLTSNNQAVKAGLEETQKQLDASIKKSLATSSGKIDRLVSEASTASQQQIRQFVDGIRTENMQQVKDYFQMTSTDQKKYIENLLVDFAQYLQQQRNNDLQLVQTRMNSLEQNTDLFKQETEQILSSIITTVGTPGSTETKN